MIWVVKNTLRRFFAKADWGLMSPGICPFEGSASNAVPTTDLEMWKRLAIKVHVRLGSGPCRHCGETHGPFEFRGQRIADSG